MEVLIRQAHPGPDVPPYHSLDQKKQDARSYKQIEDLPWPVLIDDLAGSVHQVYGGLADPAYLIDSDGVVAYYNMWTYAPNLYLAINDLMQQGGRGVVRGGSDHVPHLAATFVHGWRGIRRGLPQSYFDLELAAPGTGLGLWLGYQMRGLFEPLAIRAKPLPNSIKAMLWAAFAMLVLIGVQSKQRK